MESNCKRNEFTPKKDAESKQKKRLKDTARCTVKNVEAKVRVPETCESGESDSDIEFLKEVPGTFQDHVFVHRKVKTEVKDVDEKASVDVKIEETRRNLFHVNVSESDYSEVETETSKVKKHVNTADDADIDVILLKTTLHIRPPVKRNHPWKLKTPCQLLITKVERICPCIRIRPQL